MWRQLKFRNFKSLEDVTLELGRFTVLVGPNGAGKSSVLLGAELLAELTVGPDGGDAGGAIRQRYQHGSPLSPDKLRTRGALEDAYIVLGATVEPGAFKQPIDAFRLRLRPAASGDSSSTPWIDILFNKKEGPLTRGAGRQGENGPEAALELARLRHGPAMRLSLSGQALAQPSYLDDEQGGLRHDGYGLASVLANMAATDRDRISNLEASLKRVVPRAGRIRTPPAKVRRKETQVIAVNGQQQAFESTREVTGHKLEVEMEGAGYLDASLLSDGTLMALGILTLVHSETCPKLVLIDDLDHSLHPSGHKALVEALNSVLTERPELQIVCTTHAPYLLDHFKPDEVHVLSLDDKGHTKASKLLDHPSWKKSEGALSLGEFWSQVGEDWVAGHAAEE